MQAQSEADKEKIEEKMLSDPLLSRYLSALQETDKERYQCKRSEKEEKHLGGNDILLIIYLCFVANVNRSFRKASTMNFWKMLKII